MDEDPPLQLAELLARLEPELFDEHRPRFAIRRERLGLAARAVQRQHQLTGEALAQRVGPDGRRQLPDELGVSAVAELVLEPCFQRGQTQLLEARDLALREVLEREIGERRAAPECQRLPVAVLREQLAEAVQIELVRLDTQHVAGMPRLQPAGTEQPPQPRHVAVQRGHRAGRR